MNMMIMMKIINMFLHENDDDYDEHHQIYNMKMMIIMKNHQFYSMNIMIMMNILNL